MNAQETLNKILRQAKARQEQRQTEITTLRKMTGKTAKEISANLQKRDGHG